MVVKDRKRLDRELTVREIINILSNNFEEEEKLRVIDVVDPQEDKEKIGIFMDKDIIDQRKHRK